MKIFKDKRGNWVDVIEYMGVAFGIGVVVILNSWFLINFFDSLNNVATNTTIIPQYSLDLAEQAATTFPPAYNYILPIIFMFFVVFSVWSARKIPSSHLLLWFYPLIVLILLFISLVTESAWEQFIIDKTWDSIRDTFFVTDFFISYLRYFVLVYSTLVGWALYAKDE